MRVKLIVTDADGDKFPVVNAPVTVRVGMWKATLKTEIDYLLHTPTGWLRTTLPKKHVPKNVKLRAVVSAVTPEGSSVFKVWIMSAGSTLLNHGSMDGAGLIRLLQISSVILLDWVTSGLPTPGTGYKGPISHPNRSILPVMALKMEMALAV